MPAPPPKSNNAQHQALTTILRNIILEYPSGGGVLRELCQNADDAGATTIEFVLDTKTHITTDILHQDLAEYQGPALLAYSDSMFTEEDFDSLSRIGDSRKTSDMSVTGKFGRGFNSVYNWTDTPSILSGGDLLILDPHFTWSKVVSPESPGGPRWDYVKGVKGEYGTEMRNQLSAFSSFIKDFDNPFPGTIIRLPLRTSLKSKIVPGKSTSQEDILEVFEKFAKEIVDSLLFLRNVNTIIMRVDSPESGSFYAKAVVTAEGRDGVNKGFKEVFVEQIEEVYEKDFVMEIALETSKGEEKTVVAEKYVISHYMKKESENKQLQEWAREQKLFPWIAIATPVEVTMPFNGRLFSTLPLPVHTKHPVHIHGLFSITPDRSNIHAGGDRTMSDASKTRLGALWNTWLFQECLPHVWIRNIDFLNGTPEGKHTGWDFWPTGIQGEEQAGQLWMGVLSLVFQRIVNRNLRLLPTICGRVGKKKEILFSLKVEKAIRDALSQAGCLVVIPTEDRRSELSKLKANDLGVEELTVNTARDSLSKLKDSLENLTPGSRGVLLDYVLSSGDYGTLGFCLAPLLPISNDKFCSFDHSDQKLFFPLTPKEAVLFQHYPRMIDHKKMSKETIQQMRKVIKELDHTTCISTWTIPEAASYFKNYIFTNPRPSRNANFITLSPESRKLVETFWDWIGSASKNNHKQLSANLSMLDGLWLIPTMGDGIYHRISTTNRRLSILDVSGFGYIGKVLKEAAWDYHVRDGTQYPIYTGEGFSTFTHTLRDLRYIDSSDNAGCLINWLVENSTNFVDRLSAESKVKLLEHLGKEAKINIKPEEEKIAARKKIRILSLFREAVPTSDSHDDSSNQPWISLEDGFTYIGIGKIPVKLDANHTRFIDTSQYNGDPILSIGLMPCPSREKIIEDFVVPKINATKDFPLRSQLVTFTLEKFGELSDGCKEQLRRTEIVPVNVGEEIWKCPADVVDRSLEEYLFPEECRVPTLKFYDEYISALRELGMIWKIGRKFVLDRILEYSQKSHATQEVREKAEKLITNYKPRKGLPQKYLVFQWIPASTEEKDGLYNATECRGLKHGYLVKYAMPVMKIPVSREWETVFGWDKPLPANYVLQQLKGATEARDSIALRSLISYGLDTLIKCRKDFMEDEWVPDTRGFYHRACDIFPHDLPYGDLSPYFGTLPLELQKTPSCISLLEKMGMNKLPTFCQLKELQDKLAAKGPLNDNDLRVALFIVKEVGARFAEEDLDDFKAPDSKCLLLPLKDLTAGIPGPDDADQAVIHQEISLETIKQLGIATFQDRDLDSLLDPKFEDNFAQRESPTTAIKDTLDRYGAATTFNEYLANAEDCGSATKIMWILDNSEGYSVEKLISKELGGTQGPALFCFNDGEFSDKDFRSVIDIGVGSKQEDQSKIGKFGRGALTMYHWTSVPSFISGDSFVIFDPEEKCLPLNSEKRKRRAGMKLKLKDIRKQYPDQLLPFEGICGFNDKTTYFNGTIFRFPMRPPNQESKLKKGNIDFGKTREYLMNYYKDAIDSLLFLGKIKEISFIEKNSKEPVWEVSRRDLAITAPTEIKKFIISSHCTTDEGVQKTDREWCVISSKKSEQDLDDARLLDVSIQDRLEARYGLAALMSPQEEGFRAKNYMSLPLKKSSRMEIPVHVDANMVVQSNRTLKSSILSKSPAPLEESEMEMGAEWNKWILRDGVASLYLALVKYLMQSHGDSGYNYWPPYPSENSDVISNIISTEFWNKLVTSQHRLYLPITPKQSPSPVASDAEKPPRLRFSDAVFDLLEPDVSKFVVPLLLRLGVHNIVSPPSNIRRYLIECQAKPMKFLSSSYFLGHLRRHNSKLLQIWKELENDTDLGFFNLVFSFIFKDFFKDNISIPPAGEVKIPDLNGSTLLPLADKNLGKFRPKTSAEADCYLVAPTPQEQRLLDFVPKISVHPDFDEKVVKSLMNGGLNIKYFEFADIPRLYKEINGRRDSKLRIKWLEEMWEYYQKCIYKDPGQEKNCLKILENLKVYFGYRVGQSADADADAVFISPAQFSCGALPAVLKQQGNGVDPSVSIVLDSLPGLILLDTLAFPKKQLPKELIITFTGALGFNRLLKSINVLALESQLSIEEYIIKSLKKDGIEALRRLLDPTMMTVLLKEHSTSKGLLEQLPIWPSDTGDISSYRTAQKAMLAPNIDIPFDGLPENVVFIQARVAKDYMSQLGKFGVKKMNIDQLLAQNTRQGQSIQVNKIQRYKTFLRNLHQDRPAAFSKHPLAVNGEKKYCMVNSLYCAKDKYFRAAFRDLQKTHFLFPALQDLRLWDQVGLRREQTEHNYLECVRSIERRRREEPSLPESGQLVLDAETIYEYLKFDAQDMVKWAPESWNTLSNTPFPVKEQIGPSHRVSQTRLVRGSSHFAEFRRTVIEKYADIAWSQCPVLRITPGSIVLSRISSQGGAPSTTVVLNHLMFLSKNRSNVQKHQISAYIQDVKAAYQYLQGNKTSIIFKDRKAKIWLNIEAEDGPTITLEEFLESWKCSEDLCLNRYTSGKVQPALSFLMPFAGLLEFYGVEKVVPPPPPPGPIEFENRSEILLAAFQRFRREGKFFDIRFEVEGQVLGSHKAILAAASMYFETMFSGPWKESSLDVIQLSNDFKASTVLAVFDYIYSGEIPALDERAGAEGTYHRLVYQLELSNLWMLEDLKIKLGDQLCCEHIIRLETVTDIRQRAVDYNVPRLLSVCDEYIQNNRKLVERELSCDDSI